MTPSVRTRHTAARLAYSVREDQILQLIALGQTDKQVAVTLGISRKTVATHLGRLYFRGGHHSRTEAVVRWLATREALALQN